MRRAVNENSNQFPSNVSTGLKMLISHVKLVGAWLVLLLLVKLHQKLCCKWNIAHFWCRYASID